MHIPVEKAVTESGMSDAKRICPQIGKRERKMSGQSARKSMPKTPPKAWIRSNLP